MIPIKKIVKKNVKKIINKIISKITATSLLTCLGLAHGLEAFGVEPLHGPVFGTSAFNDKTNERFLTADLPILVPLNFAMPFASLGYRDRAQQDEPTYSIDQKITFGLLHHPMEGDPLWRLDVSRRGSVAAFPVSEMRVLVNLVKPLPWLRIRASDAVLSWIGITAITKPSGQIFWMPELMWSREDRDGMLVDVAIPWHVYLGYRTARHGPMLGVTTGVEQTWYYWTAVSKLGLNDLNRETAMTPTWDLETLTLRRQARFKMAWSWRGDIILALSALRDIPDHNQSPSYGGEASIQWNPTP